MGFFVFLGIKKGGQIPPSPIELPVWSLFLVNDTKLFFNQA